MVENRRNNSAGILVLFLMFFFFSFLQSEKERQITGSATHVSVIPDQYNPGNQAIVGPATAAPEIVFIRINHINTKFINPELWSEGKDLYNNLTARFFSSSRFKFPFEKPVICMVSLQKIPEQGNEDEFFSFI
jgi:hypothetical protein